MPYQTILSTGNYLNCREKNQTLEDQPINIHSYMSVIRSYETS